MFRFLSFHCLLQAQRPAVATKPERLEWLELQVSRVSFCDEKSVVAKEIVSVDSTVFSCKFILNKILGHNKCLKTILRMYQIQIALSCHHRHHMCFTLHFCMKLYSNAFFYCAGNKTLMPKLKSFLLQAQSIS